MSDGLSFEPEIWQYYQANHPGQVQVLGPEVGSGTAQQLAQFGVNANATYPLLLACADGSAVADTNLLVPYFQRHNFVVISRQGLIHYHANDVYPYGNRYHRDELRAAIDYLILDLTDVPGAPTHGLRLAAVPNPFTRTTLIEFVNPAPAEAHARVHVLDLSGRRVARLWDGPAPSGATRVRWDGRSGSGATLPPGVYLIHAEVGGQRLTRRLVRVQ